MSDKLSIFLWRSRPATIRTGLAQSRLLVVLCDLSARASLEPQTRRTVAPDDGNMYTGYGSCQPACRDCVRGQRPRLSFATAEVPP